MGWHDVFMEFYKNLACSLEITAWTAGYSFAVIIFYICILIQKRKLVQKNYAILSPCNFWNSAVSVSVRFL